MSTRPSLLARLLLRLRPLGNQRADVEADLYELFDRRVAERGAGYARRRFFGDVVSLWFASRAAAITRGPQTGPRYVLSEIGRDLTYALRLFRRQPAAVAMAVIGLAVGIGVCGSVFSVLNAVALRPFGIADPSTAVRVMRSQQNGISTSWPYADYVQLREHAKLVTLEAWITERLQLETESNAGPGPVVGVTFVSGGYFASLGGSAARGRVLGPADDTPAASPVAVLSHMYWIRRFGGDAAIVGRQVWLSGVPITIAGVASADFTGPSEQPPSLWLTLGAYGALFPAQASFSSSSQTSVAVLGRLAPGANAAQAEAELTAMWNALPGSKTASDYTGARVLNIDQRFAGGGTEQAGPVIAIAMVFGVVGLVLVLACGNVANLLLASASARQHEIGIRFALGASRRRIIRQLLTESLVLATTAGVLGLLLTLWTVPVLGAFIGLPPTIDPRPDLRVYLFLLIISTIAGVLAGLAPARAGTRTNLLGTIRGDATNDGRHAWSIRSRSVLVGLQAAASLIVLVLALVMARAAGRAASVETGLAANELLTMAPVSATAESGLERLGYDEARIRTFWDAVQERTAALPGVERTALALYPPFSGVSMTGAGERDGRLQIVFFNYTSPNYFQTVGLHIVRGRGYTADDARSGAPVAVISETAAREYWGAENPIGSRTDRLPGSEPNEIVIGIVSDALVARLSQYQAAAIYRPLVKPSAARLIVRASDPSRHVRAVHDIVRAIDPALRPSVSLIADGLDEERRIPATVATLAGTVAAIAIGLSVIGLIGVTAFTVARRTREVAVRVAIGASSANVVRLLLRDCLRPVVIGLAAGLVLAFLAGRLIAGTIFGVSTTDPLSFAGAVVLLCAVATVAVVIPTRKAARADTAAVLRDGVRS